MACSGAKGGVSLRGRTPAKTRTTRRRAETREVAAARTAFEAAEKDYAAAGREYQRLAAAAGKNYARWEKSEEGRKAARAYNRAFNARQRAQEAYLDATNAASGATGAFIANYRKSLRGR